MLTLCLVVGMLMLVLAIVSAGERRKAWMMIWFTLSAGWCWMVVLLSRAVLS